MIEPASAAVELQPAAVPRHVAIIMDGNRRWAKLRRMPAIEGHRRGIVALRRATRAASDAGVEVLTVYGFSTENWNRDMREISLLFDLCVYFARSEVDELRRNNVRVRVIGDWESLPPRPRSALRELQASTAQNDGLLLNLAVNYSSRAELERAM
ncbi:MAG TPA: polyprenyl diphosphate synthase, partial [Candidatus Tumulicola sp.]